jgi:hypothetical protein
MTIQLALRVRRLVGLALIGRLALVWLFLPVRLLWRIRRPALVGLTLPLVRIVLSVRIPRWLLAHDALPCTASLPCVPLQDAPKRLVVCRQYQPDSSLLRWLSKISYPFWHGRGTPCSAHLPAWLSIRSVDCVTRTRCLPILPLTCPNGTH